MAIESMSFIILEDGTRKKKSGTNVTEGQAVKLNASGELEPGTAAAKVYGISKLDSNQFRDFAFGEFGAFGSGQLTAVTKGILTLAQSTYNQIEVDTSTTTSSSPTTIKVFDDTQTYAVGDSLYVDTNGLISKVNSAGKESLLGKVLKTPAQLGAGKLELELNPPASAASADYA